MQVSLHYMDNEDVRQPLTMQGYTLTAMSTAIAADASSFLQQAVCRFHRYGTFAIATGFSVRWWEEPVAVEDVKPFHAFHSSMPQVFFPPPYDY